MSTLFIIMAILSVFCIAILVMVGLAFILFPSVRQDIIDDWKGE